ncbi:MAG: 16S rRNA (guanine(966)-N(2))-methyltransferase RsmD [Acidobacteriota bacterium]
MGEVRILGGSLRGRRLPVAPGVRPTESRVREALLSIWGPRLAEARLLELFAGSGALSFEALGRGAASALLVERSRRALELLRAAVRRLDVPARVVHLDLPGGLARLDPRRDGGFDLVFADPPYAFDRHADLLAALVPLLASDAEVVIEHGPQPTPPDAVAGLERIGTRRYGDCRLSVYRGLSSADSATRYPARDPDDLDSSSSTGCHMLRRR